MRSRSIFWLAAAAALGLAPASPASAVTITSTWEGTARVTDFTGMFGPGSGFFPNAPFRLVFTTDTETPGTVETLIPGISSQLTGVDAANPMSAEFTLLGRTFVIGEAGDHTRGLVLRRDECCVAGVHDYFTEFVEQSSVSGAISEYARVSAFMGSVTADFTTWDYRTPITFAFSDPAGQHVGTGGFEFTRHLGTSAVLDNVFATLSPRSVTVTVGAAAAPVPEPASWALMIAGFGAAGAMLRRRRSGAYG